MRGFCFSRKRIRKTIKKAPLFAELFFSIG